MLAFHGVAAGNTLFATLSAKQLQNPGPVDGSSISFAISRMTLCFLTQVSLGMDSNGIRLDTTALDQSLSKALVRVASLHRRTRQTLRTHRNTNLAMPCDNQINTCQTLCPQRHGVGWRLSPFTRSHAWEFQEVVLSGAWTVCRGGIRGRWGASRPFAFVSFQSSP